MKTIAILGSTGSIGRSALEVIRHFPDKFRVAALTTNADIRLLKAQIKEFRPRFAGVADKEAARELAVGLRQGIRLFAGQDGLEELAAQEGIDQVLLAISGSCALRPLLKAISCSKEIALANKEALVMAGPVLSEKILQKKAKIIPVDSEQSAIWQCLDGQARAGLKNIYLTASGGPFRGRSLKELRGVSIARVLKHPRWKMGRKISVDSATLMNKGLEVLEAMFLFHAQASQIKVLIHPESVIHSMVEFMDGVVLAQLSATDMRIPIQYAFSYPQRLSNSLPQLNFFRLGQLHFEKPDFKNFPCLRLAYQAAGDLGTFPAVLNAANEVSVQGFLKRELDFVSIPAVIEKVLSRHRSVSCPDLRDILTADTWARSEACRIMRNLKAGKRHRLPIIPRLRSGQADYQLSLGCARDKPITK